MKKYGKNITLRGLLTRMVRVKLLLFVMMFPAICVAEDWTLANGKTYKDVKVTSRNAVKVEFRHSSGAAAADLMELPEDIQKALSFDQAAYDAAKNALRQAAEKEGKLRRDIASSVLVSGCVLQVMEGGFLSKPSDFGNGFVYTSKGLKGTPQQGTFWITGHPDLGNLVDSDKFVVAAVESGVHTYITTTGAKATVKSYRIVKVYTPDAVTSWRLHQPPGAR